MELVNFLSNASPIALISLLAVALLRRWLVLPRELDEKSIRIRELEMERDEYKDMVFRALNVGERIADASEKGRKS